MFILNPEGRRISAVSYPYDVNLKLNYSEISELTFSVRAYTNDEPTTGYKYLVGLNYIEIPGVGVFIIIDPVTTGDGENEEKKITAYSKEYELTYKNVSLPNKTYAFFSPDPDVYSVADMIHEYAPAWSFGDIDYAEPYFDACKVYDELIKEANSLGGAKTNRIGNVELSRKMLWTNELITEYVTDNPDFDTPEKVQRFTNTHLGKRLRTEFRKIHVVHKFWGEAGEGAPEEAEEEEPGEELSEEAEGEPEETEETESGEELSEETEGEPQPLWILEVDLLIATQIRQKSSDPAQPKGKIIPASQILVAGANDNLSGLGQQICSALEKAGITQDFNENREKGITAEAIFDMDSREYEILVDDGSGTYGPAGEWIWVQDCIAGINCDLIPGADDDLDALLRLSEILSDVEDLDSNGNPTTASYARKLAMAAGEEYGETISAPDALKAEYRTYEANDNLYNFLMSTVQASYNCLFSFDTQNNSISAQHARSLRDFDEADYPDIDPVYISFTNLAREMEIQEDTGGMFNCLDVNGADGVDIRGVNPIGTNKIYNFDYIINSPELFEMRDGFIEEYETWQGIIAANEVTYRTLVAERALKNTEKNILSARRNDVDTAIEAAKIEYQSAREVYDTLKSEFDDWKAANPEKKDKAWPMSYNDLKDWETKKIVLLVVLVFITAAGYEIDNQIKDIDAELKRLAAKIEEVASACSPSNSFSAANLAVFERLIKESSFQETTFVYPESDLYLSPESLDANANYELEIISANGNSVTRNELIGASNDRGERTTYALNGGRIRLVEYKTGELLPVETSGGVQYITVDKKPAEIEAALVDGKTYTQSSTATAGKTFTYNPSTGIITFASAEPAISDDVFVYHEDGDREEVSVLFDLSAVYTTLDYNVGASENDNAVLLSAQLAPGTFGERAFETANLTIIGKAVGTPDVTTSGSPDPYQTSEWLPVAVESGVQRITVDKKPTEIDAVVMHGTTYMQDTTAKAGESFTYSSGTGIIAFASNEPEISGDVHVYYKTDGAKITGLSVALTSAGANATEFVSEDIAALIAGITVNTDGIQVYLTAPTDMTAKQQISSALYDYAQRVLRKMSQPTYTFRADVDNFFSLDEYVAFSSELTLGHACYLELLDGTVYKPIVTGVEFAYEHPESLTMSFGDRYVKSDSAYKLSDLLQKGVSMGEKLDASKYTYSSFVGTGAKDALMDVVRSDVVSLDEKSIESADGRLTVTSSGIEAKKVSDQHKSPFLSAHESNQIVLKENNLRIGEKEEEESGSEFVLDLQELPVAIGSLERSYNEDTNSLETDIYGINGEMVYLKDEDGKLVSASERITDIKSRADESVPSKDGTVTGDIDIGEVVELDWHEGLYFTGDDEDSYTPTETCVVNYNSEDDECQYCVLSNWFNLPVAKLEINGVEYTPAETPVAGSKFRYDAATNKILFSKNEQEISYTAVVYYEPITGIASGDDYAWATIEVSEYERFLIDGFTSSSSFVCCFMDEDNNVMQIVGEPFELIDGTLVPVGGYATIPQETGSSAHCVYTVTAPPDTDGHITKYMHLNSWTAAGANHKTTCARIGVLRFDYGGYLDGVNTKTSAYKLYVENGTFVLKQSNVRNNSLISADENKATVSVPLVAEDDAEIDGSLTVLDDASFGQDVDIDGYATVDSGLQVNGAAAFLSPVTHSGTIFINGSTGVRFALGVTSNVISLYKYNMSGDVINSSELIFDYNSDGEFHVLDARARSLIVTDIAASNISVANVSATSIVATDTQVLGTLEAGGRNINDRQPVTRANFITSTVVSDTSDTKIYTINGRVVGTCLLNAITLNGSGVYTVGTIASAYRPFVKQCNRLHDGKNVFINTDGSVVIQGEANKAYGNGEATIYFDYAY